MKLIQYLSLSIIFSLSCICIFGQAPEIEWMKTYGKPGMREYCVGAKQTYDGGYAIGGTASWEGSNDFMIIKTDANGDSIWSNTFGYSNENETANDFMLLPDSNYLFAGVRAEKLEPTAQTIPRAEIMLVDPNGDHIVAAFFGDDNEENFGYRLALAYDSHILLGGHTTYEDYSTGFWMKKIFYQNSCTGAPLWTSNYKEEDTYTLNKIMQHRDSMYLIVGTYRDIENALITSGFILPADRQGLFWGKALVGLTDGVTELFDATVIKNGSLVLVGKAKLDDRSHTDIFVAKYETDFSSRLWEKALGEEFITEIAKKVLPTADGGFIVAGTKQSKKNGDSDFYLLKFDWYGDTLWSKRYGTDLSDALFDFVQTQDGGFLLSGTTLEESGTYDSDVLLIKLGPEQTPESVQGKDKSKSPIIMNYPNPFSLWTVIQFELFESCYTELSVYDCSGRKVTTLLSKDTFPGIYEFSFGEEFPPGLYFYELICGEHNMVRKMIKQ